ncbi:hypothetical protein LIER_12212 [Lithospermum erythrorhizon]|uniref:Uncharacterized protein n=1 Tax=Lithospermum erythrorhizon TaxID=34254 RepID=A0AAV3PV71_LITER
MGPRVPIRWTTLKEVGSLYVRDTTFIKSQVRALRQAIPVKPSWQAYSKVWEAVQNAADPTKVEVTSMKGKRFPCFRSQVIRKPLVSGSDPISVFLVKTSSTSEASASASKRAKLEALANVKAPNLTPTTSSATVICLDDELTISTQETVEPKKKKSAPSVVSVGPPKAIIPLLANFGASANKAKGKGMFEQGEESSLDCYTARYMKAPYTLPNGLSILEGHLCYKRT